MLEPRHPVQGRRPDRFRPPHCPFRECADHLTGGRYRAVSKGSYRRARDPQRAIPRFRCPTCRRTFSREAFATSYYLKRPELLLPVANLLVSGFGRKRASVMGRAALFAVWRNMIKLVSERRPTRLTPAMRLGLTSRPWNWGEVFAERLFERRVARMTT